MKPEDISSDNLEALIKNDLQFKELRGDSALLEKALQIRAEQNWDLLMLTALYRPSADFLELIKAIKQDLLNAAISNTSGFQVIGTPLI